MSDRFEFGSYALDNASNTCSFTYVAFHNGVKHQFTEVLQLPKKPTRHSIPNELVDRVLRYLHMAIGVSYFKIFAPTEIELKTKLSKEEAMFFTQLYKKGLGEFYFKNNLDINKSPLFETDENEKREPFELGKGAQNLLIGLGGGKESIVALELLKEQGYSPTAFIVEGKNEHPVIDLVAEVAGVPVIKVKRILDDKLINPIEGSYNGHIPVSAIYSLIGYLLAVLYDFSYVVVGNEHSSNFGNILYQSVEINHQWSKSIEYERLFQSLSRSSLSPNVTYFSLLRPFYELRIVEEFIKYSQYFGVFSSCNRAFKLQNPSKTRWCGECPKCVFVFLLLSAFLKLEQLVSIFGQNLYEKEELLPLFKDVLGMGTMKPFDCVGTFDEAKVAFDMAVARYGSYKIYQFIKPTIEVSDELRERVFSTAISNAVPHQFRFSGMNNALVVGYGKEGKANEAYLKHEYPKLHVEIADEKTDPDNFNKQEQFDIALRSPGVVKEKVRIYSTTGTNLFFAHTRNTVVGVTGTKGKSTVTTLIGHLLKTAGKKVRVLGNIGEPLVTELMKKDSSDCIYVVELSSYQLDDLDYSPNIAVVTSIYNDHLDYHGDKESYIEAKKRIVKFQTKSDLYVYNDSFEDLAAWSEITQARTKPYDKDFDFESSLLKLKGQHNRENVQAAVTVCRELRVSDEEISQGLKSYIPLPHRLENVGTYKDITFYDDAIAVIPEATIAALRSLEKVDTLLLGGTDRGYDFAELERIINEKGVRNLVLFPDTGKRMFKDSREAFEILETESMKEAVEFCYKKTKPGYVCLLSTASPSYRLWKSFEQKGDEFKKYVKELAAS